MYTVKADGAEKIASDFFGVQFFKFEIYAANDDICTFHLTDTVYRVRRTQHTFTHQCDSRAVGCLEAVIGTILFIARVFEA